MRNAFIAAIAVLLGAVCVDPLSAADEILTVQEIRVRDPFIYADAKTQTYYLYAQAANRTGSDFVGVEVYRSQDLVHWQPPQPVLTLPNAADIEFVWAPEMHAYNGRFYLFVTLTYHKTLPVKKPVDRSSWPPMFIRGTHIYVADQPTGPFQPLKAGSHTPADWMALDGTLFVDGQTPYMVFCHEWVQMIDGTMDVVELTPDLSDTVGRPELLFKASSAPGARTDPQAGKVTDGCFLYRSPVSGKLFMIWSTFIPGSGYCVMLTESQSGGIKGPWIKQRPIYTKDGGHGMLFRAFDGRLLLSLHQPNSREKERLHLFEVNDTGETLAIEREVALK